ncbi:MAG: hypothetical protein IIA41_05065 [SAR324 cluster bacterium]|nr:hypothetical protein [SAR324 cluster bacterium]
MSPRLNRALKIITRRVPNRSIRAPVWMANRNGSSERAPMMTPISSADAPMESAHSGTTRFAMGRMATLKNDAA